MWLVVIILGWKTLLKTPILGMPCERLANMVHQMKKSLLDCMKRLWNMPMLVFRYALHGQLSLEKDIKMDKGTYWCKIATKEIKHAYEDDVYYIFFKNSIMLFFGDFLIMVGN